jgi:hypothetical protein
VAGRSVVQGLLGLRQSNCRIAAATVIAFLIASAVPAQDAVPVVVVAPRSAQVTASFASPGRSQLNAVLAFLRGWTAS